MARPSLAARLAARSVRSPDGCLLWMGAKHFLTKYGFISVDGVVEYTHRAAYTQAHGPIPKGMCVCHRCDVRNCIEPSHLFLGTIRDNIADRHAKGRSARGERAGNTFFTEAQVAAIHKEAGTHVAVAAKYGASPVTIRHIRSGVRWRHMHPSQQVSA